jgi:hypothetical protein
MTWRVEALPSVTTRLPLAMCPPKKSLGPPHLRVAHARRRTATNTQPHSSDEIPLGQHRSTTALDGMLTLPIPALPTYVVNRLRDAM